MPYKSEAQSRYMHKFLPGIAKRWDKEYRHKGDLPKKIHRSSAKKAARQMGY